MSEQIACVTRSINDIVKNKYNGTQSISEQMDERRKINEWSTIYVKVQECSKLFNKIFGVQLTFMIGNALLYYIIWVSYTTTRTILFERGSMFASSFFIGVLLLFLLSITMITRAAQGAKNSADSLKRSLARLLLQSLGTSNQEHKKTKDFFTLVSSSQFAVQASGFIDVDMTLLPSFVWLFSTYTVVLLQLNNVV